MLFQKLRAPTLRAVSSGFGLDPISVTTWIILDFGLYTPNRLSCIASLRVHSNRMVHMSTTRTNAREEPVEESAGNNSTSLKAVRPLLDLILAITLE